MDLPLGATRRIQLGESGLIVWEPGSSGPTVLGGHRRRSLDSVHTRTVAPFLPRPSLAAEIGDASRGAAAGGARLIGWPTCTRPGGPGRAGRMRSALVRPRSQKVIAGVCAALANRFGLSRGLVRFGFVLFGLFGIGELVYILLWIMIPKEG